MNGNVKGCRECRLMIDKTSEHKHCVQSCEMCSGVSESAHSVIRRAKYHSSGGIQDSLSHTSLLRLVPCVRKFTAYGFYICFFFFQAEDGIRDSSVTGVQTCALPILSNRQGTLVLSDRATHDAGAGLIGPEFLAGVLIVGFEFALWRSGEYQAAAGSQHTEIGRASCRERV